MLIGGAVILVVAVVAVAVVLVFHSGGSSSNGSGAKDCTIIEKKRPNKPGGIAGNYEIFAENGDVDGAQQCVYKDTIPRSVTAALELPDAKNREPQNYDDEDGPGPYRYVSSTDPTIKPVTIAVTKKSDGKYWVTGVKIG